MHAAAEAKVERPRRSRAADIDRFVGMRLRQRRIELGLTQQQMAERIGVTYQQAHKYEKGVNRVASGRLYVIAQALGVEVSYFFEDLDPGGARFRPTPGQRQLLELSHNFTCIPDRRQQDALCSLVRALVDPSSESRLGPGESIGDQL